MRDIKKFQNGRVSHRKLKRAREKELCTKNGRKGGREVSGGGVGGRQSEEKENVGVVANVSQTLNNFSPGKVFNGTLCECVCESIMEEFRDNGASFCPK